MIYFSPKLEQWVRKSNGQYAKTNSFMIKHCLSFKTGVNINHYKGSEYYRMDVDFEIAHE